MILNQSVEAEEAILSGRGRMFRVRLSRVEGVSWIDAYVFSVNGTARTPITLAWNCDVGG